MGNSTVAEAYYEKWQRGSALQTTTPFWRVIDPDSALAAKLHLGKKFLKKRIKDENL